MIPATLALLIIAYFAFGIPGVVAVVFLGILGRRL